MEAERATVLWRVPRYGEEQEMHLPAVGEALVMAPWKRVNCETFGSAEH